MVDRIGNVPSYGYTQANEKKINTGTPGTGEKFQLDYGKEGAIYEPSSESQKRQAGEIKGDLKAEETGVKLTLSVEKDETRPIEKQENASDKGIFDVLTSIVGDVFDKVKQFFLSIWNDEKKENEVVEATQKLEEPKTRFEKAKAEAEAFLSSQEGKKAARNSDLLTYYDKHGTVINVSPSDRQRILYGDKNQIEV